jgi:hypothetical protein
MKHAHDLCRCDVGTLMMVEHQGVHAEDVRGDCSEHVVALRVEGTPPWANSPGVASVLCVGLSTFA